jgi:hypothetical protein
VGFHRIERIFPAIAVIAMASPSLLSQEMPKVVPLKAVTVDGRHLYQAKGGKGMDFYQLGPGSLTMTQLEHSGSGQWKTLHEWDFSELDSSSDDSPDNHHEREIYPALYPIGPHRWAVAVVVHYSEMYSGGGAAFDWADFVELQSDEAAPMNRVFSRVPFYCDKTIRACFTEKEYKNSKHCSDDSKGWMTMTVTPSKVPARYDWVITWHEWEWPADTYESQSSTTLTTIPLRAGDSEEARAKALEDLPFCGGAQDEP